MWFVTQVLTGKEEEVRKMCVQLGVCPEKDVFYFQSEQRKKIKGEMVTVLRALFPGYLFFETATEEDAKGLKLRLRKVPAMTKLLSAGDIIVLKRGLSGEPKTRWSWFSVCCRLASRSPYV